MLHLLKGNTLSITLTTHKCLWLSKRSSEITAGDFSCNLLDPNWVDQFIHELKKIDIKYKFIEITLDNSLCRFGILPRQQEWPDIKVLEFLAIAHFKEKYPNFSSGDYKFLFNQVKFNQPIFTVALPHYIYEGLMVLNEYQNINNFSISLFKIFNVLDSNEFWYEEENFFYHVDCAVNGEEGIDIFPKKFINQESIDIWNHQRVSEIFFEKEGKHFKHWSSLVAKTPEQILNLI